MWQDVGCDPSRARYCLMMIAIVGIGGGGAASRRMASFSLDWGRSTSISIVCPTLHLSCRWHEYKWMPRTTEHARY